MATTGNAFLTIVSGLPRSGTSMMMRMIEAGGMPVLADGIREADEDNPRGYYEFEAVKKTKQDASWLESAVGKAVKMVYLLLYDLPADYQYRVLFMRRNMSEVLASQRKMLIRQGRGEDSPSDEEMAELFQGQIVKFQKWVEGRENFSVIEIDYNGMLADPSDQVDRINDFLGGILDVESMRQVVEPALYRNRG